jgi:predicted nucleotidyltransferase
MIPLERATHLSESDREVATGCKRLIHQFDPAAMVVLFGSTARGVREAESDYDILALLQQPLPSAQRDRMNDALLDLELDLGVVVSSLLLTRDEWNRPLHRVSPFYREVEREGVIV